MNANHAIPKLDVPVHFPSPLLSQIVHYKPALSNQVRVSFSELGF